MRKLYLLVASVVFLTLSTSSTRYVPKLEALPGQYASCSDGEWSIAFNFSEGQAGWTIGGYGGYGHYATSQGWMVDQLTGYREQLDLGWDWNYGDVDVASFDIVYASFGGGSINYHTDNGDSGWLTFAGGSSTYHVDLASPSAMFGGFAFETQTEEAHYGYVSHIMMAGSYYGTTCPFSDWPPITQPSTKPVMAADLVDTTVGETGQMDTLFTLPSAPIHNSMDGEVTYVNQTNNGYVVEVTAVDDTIIRYVGLDNITTSLHASITHNCVLGYAGRALYNHIGDPPGTEYGSIDYLPYVGTMENRVDYSEWDEPSGNMPCGGNSELSTEHCVNYNPNMEHQAEGWTPWIFTAKDKVGKTGLDDSGQVVIGPASFVLDYGQSFRQDLVLDNTEDWYLTIHARVLDANNYEEIRVVLGEDSETHTITRGKSLSDDLSVTYGPLDIGDPDVAPDIYTLDVRNENQSTHRVQINFACLHKGDIVETPPFCYFANNSFDTGSDGWDDTGSVSWHPLGGSDQLGAVVLDPGATISQPVNLQPYVDHDATYTLSIIARATTDVPGQMFGLGQDLNQTIDGTYESVPFSHDLGTVSIKDVLIAGTYDTEIVVSDDHGWVGNLTVENDSGNSSQIEIQSMCLTPVTGIWPGTADDTAKDKRDDRFVCNACESVSAADMIATIDIDFGTLGTVSLPIPDLSGVIRWLSFWWCQLRNFISCDLLRAVSKILDWVDQIRNGVGYAIRWASGAVTRFGAWIATWLEWVSAWVVIQFYKLWNNAWHATETISPMQAVYDLVALLYAIATFTSDLVDHVINFGIMTFTALLMLGKAGLLFAASLISSAGEPAAALGSSSCTTPTGVWVGLCAVYEVLAGVITILPATATGIFVYAGAIGVRIMVWSFSQIGTALSHV